MVFSEHRLQLLCDPSSELGFVVGGQTSLQAYQTRTSGARLNLSDGFMDHLRPANTTCNAINYRRHLLYKPRSLQRFICVPRGLLPARVLLPTPAVRSIAFDGQYLLYLPASATSS
jgi:hypothetical protein